MAKRFPIPRFDYEDLKGHAWSAPSLLDAGEARRIAEAARAGDAGAFGAYPVAAEDAWFDALGVRGPHRHAVLCALPGEGATMLGRSHAWKLQRAVALDSLEPGAARVLVDWKTPRPMNTRLGPQDGVTAPAAVLYLVLAHRFADHWVANRTTFDDDRIAPGGAGFRVLACDDEDLNDFHAGVVEFRWRA